MIGRIGKRSQFGEESLELGSEETSEQSQSSLRSGLGREGWTLSRENWFKLITVGNERCNGVCVTKYMLYTRVDACRRRNRQALPKSPNGLNFYP